MIATPPPTRSAQHGCLFLVQKAALQGFVSEFCLRRNGARRITPGSCAPLAAVLQFAADAKAAHAPAQQIYARQIFGHSRQLRRCAVMEAKELARLGWAWLGFTATSSRTRSIYSRGRSRARRAPATSRRPSHRPSTHPSDCTRRFTVQRVPSTRAGAWPDDRVDSHARLCGAHAEGHADPRALTIPLGAVRQFPSSSSAGVRGRCG
jgi:hypothetical protein